MKTIANLVALLTLAALMQVAPQPGHAAGAAPSTGAEAAPGITAQATNRVLQDMEYLRGYPGTGFNFVAEVVTVDNSVKSEQYTLDVKINEKGYALIEVLAPKNQRGRRTLLRDRDFWLYLPSSSNIIRVAPLQRVFGAASIADVLNVSYLSGYAVETSSKPGNGNLLELGLKSKESDATYARIDLDYDLATNRPTESRHYAASNRLLKTIQYKGFQGREGSPKVEKIAIVDGIRPSSVVWMKMGEYKRETYPDSMFTKAALSRK